MHTLNKNMKHSSVMIVILCLGIAACSQSQKRGTEEQKTQAERVQVHLKPLSPEDSAKYLEMGDDIVGETKRKISTTLMEAMEKGSVKYAAQFCNLVAYPIVDSMSKAHNARIRRVSDRPRNPKDAMDEDEKKVFAMFKEKMSQPNAEVKPILVQYGDGTVGYYTPIKISMPVCLKCHGEVGKDITTEDYAELKRLYPEDKAVGYKEGELRGMFSIRFTKSYSQAN